MPIILACPCGQKLRLAAGSSGARIRCPRCKRAFTAPDGLRDGPDDSEAISPDAPLADLVGRIKAEPAPQFWVECTWRGGTITALSGNDLHVAEFSNLKLRAAWRDLKHGVPVAKALDPAKVVIPYRQMQKVQCNLHNLSVEIEWRAETGDDVEESDISFANAKGRDEFLAALQQRLGIRWEREVVQYGKLRAAWSPLGLVAGCTLICVLMLAAQEKPHLPGLGRLKRGEWLMAKFVQVAVYLFGPFAIVWLTAPVIVGGLVWLVVRVRKPPRMLTLAVFSRSDMHV